MSSQPEPPKDELTPSEKVIWLYSQLKFQEALDLLEQGPPFEGKEEALGLLREKMASGKPMSGFTWVSFIALLEKLSPWSPLKLVRMEMADNKERSAANGTLRERVEKCLAGKKEKVAKAYDMIKHAKEQIAAAYDMIHLTTEEIVKTEKDILVKEEQLALIKASEEREAVLREKQQALVKKAEEEEG